MSSYTKGKNAFIRLCISFFAALCVITGMYFLRDGPRLGQFFDFLASKQSPPPVAPGILIIETPRTDTLMDPSTAASVIMTMAEMGATNILIQTPILGVSASADDREAELLDLFNREFDQLGRNIQNLFDGIRMGTIPPAETNRFVGVVLSLAEEGKERLVNEAVRRTNVGTLELERAKTVFPNTGIADDHSVELARQSTAPRSGRGYSRAPLLYSHAVLDRDGHLRRIVPLETDNTPNYEHIVFNTLKNRFGHSTLATNPAGHFLIMEKVPGLPSPDDRSFTLDKDGAIILKTLHKDQSFRRMSLVDLIEYEKLDRALYKALSESTDMGPYGNVSAEKYPSYLWEREREMRNDLYQTMSDSLRLAWIDARNAYLVALEQFFYRSSVESNIGDSFSSLLLEEEELTEEGNEQIGTMRDNLLAAFHSAREVYNQFNEIRTRLDREISNSFCILGAASVDIQASAVLANTIITGSTITLASARYIFFWSICVVFLCVLILRVFAPFPTVILGAVFTAAVLVGFSYSFIATMVWLDPFIPLCGTASGVFVSILCSLVMKRNLKQRFQISYGPHVAKSHLGYLIRAGRPVPEDCLSVRAAIIAVKNPALNPAENGQPAKVSAAAITKFREEVKKVFLKTGAAITGVNGDTVLVAFGSPVERVALYTMKNEMPYDDDDKPRGTHNPVKKAVGFLTELIDSNQQAGRWHYGVDYGECVFTWTALAGYAVFGPPSYGARLLAAQGCRHKVRVFVSKNCADKIDGALMRRHAVTADGTVAAEFYELLIGKAEQG
jgi:class 3 adenylate cyclase